MKTLKIIEKRFIFYFLSIVLFLFSLYLIIFKGFNWSIDFVGGSQVEGYFAQEISTFELKEKLKEFGLNEVLKSGGNKYIMKFAQLDENRHQELLTKFKEYNWQFTEENFITISSLVSRELKKKTITAILLVLILIAFYISFAFRKKTKPINSFIFGLTALLALFHDVIISLGFVIFNKFDFDISIVVAILTLAGFSVHDTIVVFDRLRENLSKVNFAKEKLFLDNIINLSISSTMARSINTSLTTILALIVGFFVFGKYVQSLILTLIFGIVIGTYSSIFIASPLIYEIYKNKLKQHER